MNRLALTTVLLLAGLLGCAAPQQTAVVTERPAPADTLVVAEPAPAPVAPAWTDTVTAGRFDWGKMWTFDDPPTAYFQEAYGFAPDDAWFERARLGALRFASYCSASFVSPNGLVLTNHHCARESVTEVSEEGENLLDDGFYAETLDAERRVDDLYVDQLVEIADVTDDVYGTGEDAAADDAQARAQRADALEARLTDDVKGRDSTLYVQVVALYQGGRYSAYTFRRYDDVRLVMAPELQIGYYGGDPDNFTYPRYNLDMSLLRVYDADGAPLASEHYFPWSRQGLEEGDAVFVVGNPGTTQRLTTVSQLEYLRDYELPQQLDVLDRRAEILQAYVEAHPDSAEAYDLRNPLFSIENSRKANRGQLAGLQDPYLIARRSVAEEALRDAVQASDSLRSAYGTLFRQIADVQTSKEATAPQAGAFTYFLSSSLSSHVLARAMYGYFYNVLQRRGAPAERLDEIREEALGIEDWPAEVEQAYITARLEELQRYLGPGDPTLRRILDGRTPAAVADSVVSRTALVDSSGFAQLLEAGYLNSGDASVPLIEALAPLYLSLGQQLGSYQQREQTLSARLSRALFAVYGTDVPPDASFSLRIADGVVRGYTYNGTRAPAFTTLFGLYNHYFSYGDESPWDLPERWLPRPADLDLATPLNLVSTNDITGGNSGSPLLNRDLELVGLVFDGNIESLPNQYLFTETVARTVSVDARGMLEALGAVYEADRVVLELTTGELVETDEAAEAQLVE